MYPADITGEFEEAGEAESECDHHQGQANPSSAHRGRTSSRVTSTLRCCGTEGALGGIFPRS